MIVALEPNVEFTIKMWVKMSRQAGPTDNRDLTASKILANVWMHRNRRSIRLRARCWPVTFPEPLGMPTCKDIFCSHLFPERCLT